MIRSKNNSLVISFPTYRQKFEFAHTTVSDVF